jgi:hypothetical protein
MSNNNPVSPPGLISPTQKSFTSGAGNPRDSAMMETQNMNNKQASLNASVGGKRRRKFKGGALAVPQYPMPYTPQGGTGTNPNDQIKTNSSTSMQSTSWASNDNQATNITPAPPVGGFRRKSRHRKGGSSKYSWGCYSGGRKTRRKNKNYRKKSFRRYHR